MARLRIAHIRLLIPFVVLAWRATLPLGDNSFLWHVRAGSLQLDTGEVLRVDPFSFTALGEAWRTQSWLIELGYGWLEQSTSGIAWVPSMKFIVMSLTLVFLGLVLHRVDRGRHWVTLGGVFLLLWQAAPFGIARPALVGFLFLAVTVAIANTPRTPLWLLPLLFWLWASVHGMFAVGLAYLFLDAMRKRSQKQIVAVAAAGVATAFTAHGLGAWWIVLQFLRSRGALELISEWQPPDFSNPFLMPLLIVIIGIIVAGVRGRLATRDLWVVVPFVAFGLLAERNVWPAVIVLTPLWLQRDMPPERRSSTRTESIAANWAFAVVLVGVSVLGLSQPLRPMEERFPVREAVATIEPGAPLFNGSAVGGYLIYADWPGLKVYIDDRAELYGAEGFQQFNALKSGVDVEVTFDDLGIEQAIVSADWPIVGYLDLLGWEERYRDDYFVVMADSK